MKSEHNLTYTKHDDYLLPDLCLPEQNPDPIGKYGLLRKTYLKTHRKITYTNLLTAGALHDHLSEIDAQANEELELLMTQMAAAQGITEQIKADNQLLWVGAMNNIKSCAEEIILTEIIYT
ncbi:MAG: TnpV protein [Oscillospiraceae bacterium]|nr:TnpV protein [Oscillospiraceae bacterium]